MSLRYRREHENMPRMCARGENLISHIHFNVQEEAAPLSGTARIETVLQTTS